MSAGYGSDTTASDTDPSTGQPIADSIASIFQTGITAYADSQAVQNGYQINDPRYYQSGYPAGQSLPYVGTTQGQGVATAAPASNMNKYLLLAAIAVGAYLLLK